MKKTTFSQALILLAASFLFLFSGCQQEEDLQIGIQTIDLVLTDIKKTWVAFEGDVITQVPSKIINRGIVYSHLPNPTTLDGVIDFGRGEGAFADTIKDLIPFQTYYARGYVSNIDGIFYGPEVTFETTDIIFAIPCSPDVNTYVNANGTVTKFDIVTQGLGNGREYCLEADGFFREMTVTFPEAPNSGIYYIKGGYRVPISGRECSIWADFGGGWSNRYYGVRGDSLFVDKLGEDHYSVTFCDIQFEGANTSNQTRVSGNITYK